MVEADDTGAAENLASQMLRDGDVLRGLVQNPADDPPTMQADDIYEIKHREDFEEAENYIWFEMKPKHWWQFWRR